MRFRPPKPVAMTLNLAPMVDVMMCLIIFFLLASKLVDAQHRPLNLPYAKAATELERGELGRYVVINVQSNADDPLRADYIVEIWDGKNIAERRLEPPEVEEYLNARAAAARADNAEIRCVIRADRDVCYAHVEVVLRGCGLAGIAKITFSARAGDEPEDNG